MKHFVPPLAAVVGWVFAVVAFPNSASDCRLIYQGLSALAGLGITGLIVWVLPMIPPPTPEQIEYQRWVASWTPPVQRVVYHAPSVDAAWAEGQRERARLMWLDGTPVPPTDFYGARGY